MRLFIRHCLTRQPIWKRLYQTKGFPNKVGIYLSKDQQGTLSIHTNKSIFLKKKKIELTEAEHDLIKTSRPNDIVQVPGSTYG